MQQENLSKMSNWSDDWLLRFHPDKGKYIYMNISRSKNPLDFDNKLKGKTLNKVKQE